MRWLQHVRRYRHRPCPRRLSVVVGFYCVCVIDAILPHSAAGYVRRPTVPAASPTLGLHHLQFEALITTACERDGRPAGRDASAAPFRAYQQSDPAEHLAGESAQQGGEQGPVGEGEPDLLTVQLPFRGP